METLFFTIGSLILGLLAIVLLIAAAALFYYLVLPRLAPFTGTTGTITLSQTWTRGIIESAVLGFTLGLVTYLLIRFLLNFWHLGEILGMPVGLCVGFGFAGWAFWTRLKTIEPYWAGVELDRGRPTGRLYENGTHCVPFLRSLRAVPHRGAQLTLLMAHEEINTRDGSGVRFGVDSEDARKRNRIMYEVVAPVVYIGVADPDDAMREEFLDKARIFFSKMATAIGAKVEKSLFSDYLMLEPSKDDDGNITDLDAEVKIWLFMKKLHDMTFEDEVAGTPQLFEDEGLQVIYENAGEFLKRLGDWGLGEILVFTPNVRMGEEIESAISEKAAADEIQAAVSTRVKNLTRLTKKLRKDTGMSPDLAGAMVARAGGENLDVTINHHTQSYPGIPEAIQTLGLAAIDKFGPKDPSSSKKSPKGGKAAPKGKPAAKRQRTPPKSGTTK